MPHAFQLLDQRPQHLNAPGRKWQERAPIREQLMQAAVQDKHLIIEWAPTDVRSGAGRRHVVRQAAQECGLAIEFLRWGYTMKGKSVIKIVGRLGGKV